MVCPGSAAPIFDMTSQVALPRIVGGRPTHAAVFGGMGGGAVPLLVQLWLMTGSLENGSVEVSDTA